MHTYICIYTYVYIYIFICIYIYIHIYTYYLVEVVAETAALEDLRHPVEPDIVVSGEKK